ncbi:MAG: hypothetical protein B7Y40_06755 [Gammaproteobacteria bacterium 28-57-27]|nr:MAG: hypothetical protein B7Y40_06755 [Gammaproteobacteria bacterium 28-57-27]
MKERMTLRMRLLAGVLLAVLCATPFTLLGVYGDAHHELDELFDAHLEQLARLHLSMDRASAATQPPILHPYTSKILVRHTWNDGRSPARWDSEPAPFPPGLDGASGFGDFEGEDGEMHWRYIGLWSAERNHHVLIMQDNGIREELASSIARRVSLQSLIELPFLALIIIFMTTLALRPLRAIVLALRNPDPLQVRLPPAHTLPRELAVVVESFDRLLERFRDLLERERHFAAVAAHELRTPLAGLSAQLQLLEVSDSPNPRALTQARHAARHLSTLVDRLLLLARMDRNQVQTHAEAIDLHELILECAALVQDHWPQREIQWDITPPGDPCWQAWGDPTLIRMLLLNLLDNACKHGSDKLSISVHAHCEDEQRTFVIEDDGPGIPSEQLARLQQRFARASEHTAGLGLGLALAREILILHGGMLLLLPNEPHGLRVKITLPPAPDTQA